MGIDGIEVKNLHHSYSKDKAIINDVSFKVRVGEILCLLGQNGTGKTTLLRCILGLNKVHNGEVIINGENVLKLSIAKRAKIMAYVPQFATTSFSYLVKDIVMMGRVSGIRLGYSPSVDDERVVSEIMERLEISYLKNMMFNEISGGQKQMVLIARALAQRAKIMILDEPTSSLDFSNQIKILKTLNSLSADGHTIIMTSHYPEHAFLCCSKALLMKNGNIFDIGVPIDVVTSEKLTKIYSAKICVTNAIINNSSIKVCVPLMS